MNKEEIKKTVKDKYSRIAQQSNSLLGNESQGCCDATGCCSDVDYTVFSERYDELDGYNKDADLGLGCGIPTEFAKLEKGQHVLDLGSGAGNDCFVARAIVGEEGKVTGIDFSEDMVAKARENAGKLGYDNVEFISGDIEEMPLENNTFDVVISNCVLNLVPDKEKAFDEIIRVLKPGGHLSVSDIVLKGELPEKLQNIAEMYAGCVSGALQMDHYLKIMENSGFKNIKMQKSKVVNVPDDILLQYIDKEELSQLRKSGNSIVSITVYAEKAI